MSSRAIIVFNTDLYSDGRVLCYSYPGHSVERKDLEVIVLFCVYFVYGKEHVFVAGCRMRSSGGKMCIQSRAGFCHFLFSVQSRTNTSGLAKLPRNWSISTEFFLLTRICECWHVLLPARA